jgi:hypothetical protein
VAGTGAASAEVEESKADGGVGWVAAASALVAGLLAWLWPIGLGGQMPVGGDVTRFSIGLMAELGRAIRAGRIPFWNDLWGYGFPGLAESQMGVYYPPHILLYGALPVELAYTLALVLHTLWAGLGAAWASRRLGTSPRGALLAGFAWATCGFFLVHLPHQWGATTACWMPWAWGLAWMTATGEGGRRAPLLLAAVLALQILPGHFQLAFNTEVTAGLLGLCGLISRGRVEISRWHRALRLGLALGAVLPLALAQLGPTAELAALARSQRDPEYLSAFASPPVHLVSYVAPGLFHRSPLWRPLAWDALHAMPEEHLATIGLVPLFLAWLAVRGGGRDPRVRSLLILASAATLFSLGPYVPGFGTLCGIPGFSFFRAPARWGAAAMLALALLAGRGFDALPTLPRPGRSLRRFVLITAACPVLIVGLIEVAFAANEPVAGRPAWPEVSKVLNFAFRMQPWLQEPELSVRIAEARRPLDDIRVPIAQARQGLPFSNPNDRNLAHRRGSIYMQELAPTYLLLAGLLAASFLATRKPRAIEGALLLILLVEAGYWSRQRPFDLGPIRPLVQQSGVLAKLAELPRGTRSIDPAGNLSMVVGVAPVAAYRTLDLPVLPGLIPLAARARGMTEATEARRALGVGVCVYQVGELGRGAEGPTRQQGWYQQVNVLDPTLLGWLTGMDWARSLGETAATYSIWRPESEPSRAFYLWREAEELIRIGNDPHNVLVALASARPLEWLSSRPEEVNVRVQADQPGTVILSQLDYPRWHATLEGASAAAQRVPILRLFDGWQGVKVPAGNWTLRLKYDATRDWVCLAISGLAWTAWGLLYWRSKPSGVGRAGSEETR